VSIPGREVGRRKGRMRVYMIHVLCIHIYENRRMKPAKIVLRRGGGEKRENDGGSKSN
jgi:hypothetical protein